MILKEMLKANSRLEKKDFKLEKNIKILENEINEKEKNKANLIKLYTMNKITDDEFEKIKNEYQDEIMDYKSQLIQLKVNRDANETGKNQQKIKKFFDFDTFELTKEFIHEKIDRIYVQGIEKIHIDDIIKLCERNVGNKYLTPNKNLKIFLKNGQIYFIDQR